MTPSAASEVASLRTTVLFIDDNPADLDFWSQGLRECSPAYSTLTATDIKSGLHLYQSQKVDCVILDLDLSGESGFEALFTLIPNRHRPSVPVVVLTKLPYPTYMIWYCTMVLLPVYTNSNTQQGTSRRPSSRQWPLSLLQAKVLSTFL